LEFLAHTLDGWMKAEKVFWLLHKKVIEAIVEIVCLVKGRLAEVKNEEDDSQREDVCLNTEERLEVLTAENLGRHESFGSKALPHWLVYSCGHPEVAQFKLEIVADQDVVKLEIEVGVATLVHVGRPFQDLCEDKTRKRYAF
jgi:hypothetical protein